MHNITQREDGFVEFCFTGERKGIWHGLGNELEDNASIEVWKKQAGMDWEVKETPVVLQINGDNVNFPDRKGLYRSDNGNPLSIVGDKYKIVQPGEILEFFRDLVEIHGMKLSTAGTLFGGKRFWALADVGKSFEVSDGDRINGNLLLTTSVDGTLSTIAKFISTRVVCNNTLTVALEEQSSNIVRVTHKSEFDPKEVKIDLGILDKGWNNLKNNLIKLSEKKMNILEIEDVYEDLFFDHNKSKDDQTWGVKKMLNELLVFSTLGSGSDMHKGTAFGALCGATEYFTHGTRKRSADKQFVDAYSGNADKKKTQVYNKLLEIAA